MTARRILIVLHGAIGDVIRAMPLAMRLRRRLPEAHLAWAVEPTAHPLLVGHPAIDELVVFRRDLGARAFLPFLLEVRRGRFDVVLDLQRHLKSGVVGLASGARVRIGFHRRNAREGNWFFNNRHLPPTRHLSSKVEQFLGFAEALGVAGGGPVEFGLEARPDELELADERLRGLPGPRIAAFVGSTWKSRWWFPEATAAVLSALHARFGCGAVLIGAPSERSYAEDVERRIGPIPVRNLVGETGLRDLIAIFSRSEAAFGPDSGPMHLAAAVGLRVVSLWGATSPLRSAPVGSEDLAVVGDVPCHPCYLRVCPIETLCMQRIHPEAVTERLVELLEDRTR